MNMQNIMAQAQRMQKEMQKKQEEVCKMTFEGKSEWVKVRVNGKREILSTEITYEGDLNSDKDMLGDMITLAIKDAFTKVDKEYENKLGMYGKQLNGLL